MLIRKSKLVSLTTRKNSKPERNYAGLSVDTYTQTTTPKGANMGLAGNKKLGACGSGVYRVSDMPGPVPPYGQRNGWIPRTLTDYGGGGAFPEIHVAQYPLDMGRKGMNETALILSSSLDAEGKNEFSKIAEYGHRKDEIVYSQFKDLVPRNVEYKDEDLARPDAETEAEIAARTRAALSEILDSMHSFQVD